MLTSGVVFILLAAVLGLLLLKPMRVVHVNLARGRGQMPADWSRAAPG